MHQILTTKYNRYWIIIHASIYIVTNPIISFPLGKRYLKCDRMLSCYLYYEVILCVNDFEIEIKQLSSMLPFYLRKRLFPRSFLKNCDLSFSLCFPQYWICVLKMCEIEDWLPCLKPIIIWHSMGFRQNGFEFPYLWDAIF